MARHEGWFPGIEIEHARVRTYPQNTLAAQALDTLGPIAARELQEDAYRAPPSTAMVGQSGLEGYYNSPLQGGDTLKTTLDVPLQRVGQQALQHEIDLNYPANGGAFVALDPDNGQIYAMGSLPTYDANVFTKPVPTSAYNSLFGPNSGDPQVNRAYQSAGPLDRRSSRSPRSRRSRAASGALATPTTTLAAAPGAVPAQLRARRRRRARPDRRAQGLIKRLLRQSRRAHRIRPPTGRARHIGARVRYRPSDGSGPPWRERRHPPTPTWRTQRNQLEDECDARRAVRGPAQTSAGWLRDCRRV